MELADFLSTKTHETARKAVGQVFQLAPSHAKGHRRANGFLVIHGQVGQPALPVLMPLRVPSWILGYFRFSIGTGSTWSASSNPKMRE